MQNLLTAPAMIGCGHMLKSGAAIVGGAALPGALASEAAAAPIGTLVVAAPATPQSLDSNFDVSQSRPRLKVVR
jgi:hypothetical protein